MMKLFELMVKHLDGDTLQDVVKKIRGKKGTAVTMTII